MCFAGVCRILGYCGDGVRGLDENDQPEDCDGPLQDFETCEAIGFSGGQLECAADCSYDTSGCSAGCEGECAPGDVDACGYCGIRTCDAECNWGTCDEGAGCTPGDSEVCGDCGSRTCQSDCTWGDCQDEGCHPGNTRDCGDCGSQTCNADCTWGGCQGEGVCTPGATSSTSCGTCPSGGTKTRSCNSICSWDAYDPCTSDTCTGDEVCFSAHCVDTPANCTTHLYNNHLYAKCPYGITWGGARSACNAWDGGAGYLFVVNSYSEYMNIRQSFNNNYFWIAWKQTSGSSEPTAGWSTTYSNHTSTYTYWTSGEPNNGTPGQCGAPEEDCCVAGREDGNAHWNDDDCTCEYYFVCELNP